MERGEAGRVGHASLQDPDEAGTGRIAGLGGAYHRTLVEPDRPDQVLLDRATPRGHLGAPVVGHRGRLRREPQYHQEGAIVTDAGGQAEPARRLGAQVTMPSLDLSAGAGFVGHPPLQDLDEHGPPGRIVRLKLLTASPGQPNRRRGAFAQPGHRRWPPLLN
jgi:hypothetical protein